MASACDLENARVALMRRMRAVVAARTPQHGNCKLPFGACVAYRRVDIQQLTGAPHPLPLVRVYYKALERPQATGAIYVQHEDVANVLLVLYRDMT